MTQVISGGVLLFQAALPVTFTTLGVQNITAQYNGNQNFSSAASSVLTVHVVQPSTTVVTTDLPNPTAAPSQNVTLTAIVTGDGVTAPTGTVTFSDNGNPITQTVTYTTVGTTLHASVVVPTSLLQQSGTTVLLPGQQTITAAYNGDTSFFTSNGAMVQTVKAQAFGANDALIYRAGDGTTAIASNIGALVFLDEYTTGATPTLVQSISLPTAFGTPFTAGSIIGLVASGNSSSEGELSLSADGQYVVLTGTTQT